MLWEDYWEYWFESKSVRSIKLIVYAIWDKIRTVKQNTNKKMKNLSSSAHKLLLNIATKLKKFFIFLTQLMFTHKHNKWSQTFQPRPRWGLSRLCGSKVSVQACLANISILVWESFETMNRNFLLFNWYENEDTFEFSANRGNLYFWLICNLIWPQM